jgi:hypothetical protein
MGVAWPPSCFYSHCVLRPHISGLSLSQQHMSTNSHIEEETLPVYGRGMGFLGLSRLSHPHFICVPRQDDLKEEDAPEGFMLEGDVSATQQPAQELEAQQAADAAAAAAVADAAADAKRCAMGTESVAGEASALSCEGWREVCHNQLLTSAAAASASLIGALIALACAAGERPRISRKRMAFWCLTRTRLLRPRNPQRRYGTARYGGFSVTSVFAAREPRTAAPDRAASPNRCSPWLGRASKPCPIKSSYISSIW